MAGHYFYDPRPFYGQNGSNGLMPLDELFYGRYEPVPYWMDQRMAPVSAFDDYYPGHKQMAMGRPPPQLMQYAYKRPESRDDIGVDLYRRSPYNFHGVGAPMGYGGQPPPPLRQSQDDTWVHAMSPYAQHPGTTMTRTNNTTNDHYMEAPMGYIPSTNLNATRGMEMPMMNTKGNNNNNNNNTMTSMGNHGSKQMNSSSTQFGNKSSNGFGNSNNGHGNSNNGYGNSNNGHGNSNNGHGNGNNGYGNGNSGYGNSNSGHGNGSSGHGNSNSGYGNGNSGYGNGSSGYGNGSKAMNSKQGGSTKGRYVQEDSSSDDSDDEYGNNNGVKWATKGSVKHGNGHQNFTQKSGLKGNNNYGYDSMHLMSSKSKSSGHRGGKSGGSHGHSTQSKLSKLFRFGDSSSSDSDDDGYRHTKKSSSKGTSNNYGNHGSHGSQGSFLSHGHQQQSKQMQYGSSQSRGVELKVPICCDNCERKVRECLEYMAGVENVLCDQWNRKVIVYGNVKPENVLKRVRKVKKASELWQQGKQNQQLRVY